jgi:hypothetical protein
MRDKPESIDGDLLGLSLVSALIKGDMRMVETVVHALGTRQDLLGALRVLSNCFAASLTVNLTQEGALRQVEMYRAALIEEFSNET